MQSGGRCNAAVPLLQHLCARRGGRGSGFGKRAANSSAGSERRLQQIRFSCSGSPGAESASAPENPRGLKPAARYTIIETALGACRRHTSGFCVPV